MYDRDHAKKYNTLKLPIELHKQVKLAAAQEGLSMIQLLDKWVLQNKSRQQ